MDGFPQIIHLIYNVSVTLSRAQPGNMKWLSISWLNIFPLVFNYFHLSHSFPKQHCFEMHCFEGYRGLCFKQNLAIKKNYTFPLCTFVMIGVIVNACCKNLLSSWLQYKCSHTVYTLIYVKTDINLIATSTITHLKKASSVTY